MSTEDTSSIGSPLTDNSAKESLEELDTKKIISPVPIDIQADNKIILCSYKEAPEFLQDNELIKNGYLLNCNTINKVLRSLFICHNESINIWSHLLGAIGVIFLVFYTGICINEHSKAIYSVIDLSKMIEEIKEMTNPWISTLNASVNNDYNNNNNNEDMSISHLIVMTHEFIMKINERLQITNTIWDYIDNTRSLIDSIKGKIAFNILEQAYNKLQLSLIDIVNKATIIFKDMPLDTNSGSNAEESSSSIIEGLTRAPLFVMLTSAFICLGFSSFFHWFKALSKETSSFLSRLDYAGITILISGSCYPPFYYFFYCKTLFQGIYLGLITLLSVSVFIYTLTPNYYSPERRKLRGSLFLALGLSTIIPFIHLAFFTYSIPGFERTPNLFYWYTGGASYVFGALLYIFRIPERFRPGKHDFFGASHQIFHCFVVLGVVLHYLGSIDSYTYRLNYQCPVTA